MWRHDVDDVGTPVEEVDQLGVGSPPAWNPCRLVPRRVNEDALLALQLDPRRLLLQCERRRCER
eukprot:6075480-Prymnesium_polylepis.1